MADIIIVNAMFSRYRYRFSFLLSKRNAELLWNSRFMRWNYEVGYQITSIVYLLALFDLTYRLTSLRVKSTSFSICTDSQETRESLKDLV